MNSTLLFREEYFLEELSYLLNLHKSGNQSAYRCDNNLIAWCTEYSLEKNISVKLLLLRTEELRHVTIAMQSLPCNHLLFFHTNLRIGKQDPQWKIHARGGSKGGKYGLEIKSGLPMLLLVIEIGSDWYLEHAGGRPGSFKEQEFTAYHKRVTPCRIFDDFRPDENFFTVEALRLSSRLRLRKFAYEFIIFFFDEVGEAGLYQHIRTVGAHQMDLVKKVEEILKAHLETAMPPVDAIARSCHVSVLRLRKVFKIATGKSITAHYLDIKMQHAFFLLEKDALNVSEVAYRSGYSVPAQFTAVFKKYFGYPPSEVLKRKNLVPETKDKFKSRQA